MDESKIQKKNVKQKRKAKPKPKKNDESSPDEFFEMYLEEKRQKLQVKKQQRASVRKVQISTPVQKQLRRKKENLLFEVSPIRPDDSDVLEEESERSRGASLYEELYQKRLKEIDEKEKERAKRFKVLSPLKIFTNTVKLTADLMELEKDKDLQPSVDAVKASSAKLNINDNSEVLPTPDESHFINKRSGKNLPRKRKHNKDADNGNSMNTEARINISMMEVPEINVSMVNVPDLDNSISSLENMQEATNEREMSISPVQENVGDAQEAITELPKDIKNCDNSVIEEMVKQIAKKKSVAINLVPAVHNISIEPVAHPRVSTRRKSTMMAKKSVGFSHASIYEENESTKDITLQPGKWRKSLIAWRKSRNTKSTARRTSIILEESASSKIEQYSEKLLNALGDCE